MSIFHLEETDHREPAHLKGAELGRMAETFEVMNTVSPTLRERFNALGRWMINHPRTVGWVGAGFLLVMVGAALGLPSLF